MHQQAAVDMGAQDLTPAELCEVAEDLGRRPWDQLPLDFAADRSYRELSAGERLSAWVIHWGQTADTGFHDHDLSAGAVHVIRGRLREERLRLGGQPECREYGPGQTFTIAPSEIHRVLHVGDGPALTVHAYSPRLLRMGVYVVESDGTLSRHSVSHDDHLGSREQPAPALRP